MKAKIRFVKFKNGLAMQVLEMDERFRVGASGENMYKCNGFSVISSISPGIYHNKCILLRGYEKNSDSNISTIGFENNDERDEYLEKAICSLQEWAENWKGFQERNNFVEIDFTEQNDFVLEV